MSILFRRFFRLRSTISLLVLLCASGAQAQTLARPGWVGSGMSATSWWKHGVVYQADPRGFGGLHGLAEHLDYIHSLGVDALLLSSLGGDAQNAIDPELGTMDDLDEIVRRASQNNIRVLVELNAHANDLQDRARLWLAHGVAGFRVAGATTAQIAELRKSESSFAGQRVVIGDVDAVGSAQMIADPRAGTQEKLAASSIRPALEAAQQIADEGRSVPLLLSDGAGMTRSMTRYADGAHDADVAKMVAAMLMTTRAASLIYFGQELGLTDGTNIVSFEQPAKKGEQPAAMSVAAGDASPASLLNWYRQLSAMTHSNRTMSSGAIMVLNHDDQNVLAWVRRPQSVSLSSPAIVVIENLSAQPVTILLKADMQRLRLKGSFLRTLARSDSGMGAMHLDGMTLAPYSVFIGELRY
ncbi:alpha-amylase family glycosyl hydrolase [Edaphobacter aggregans]|uniref:alpha-amylase family glycosyl hydrolase n=1 Tax=Edaphobacter aggregans TaxID=570835 RepID=UPI0005569A70|nr:alpha-amylase family glycosyl hydrolase [Edaphobacter aggregans]